MCAVTCRPYTPADRAACLRLFASNTPEFFHPAERAAYASFLDATPPYYQVCLRGRDLVGAFGLDPGGAGRHGRLRWILTAAAARGTGLGAFMMQRVLAEAAEAGFGVIHIAASQKSAPFFARYGATESRRTPDGWGPGLDRIDLELRLYSVPDPLPPERP